MSLLEEVVVTCPYCGEANEMMIDTSVSHQQYVEDCQVCCQPILLRIEIDETGVLSSWMFSVKTGRDTSQHRSVTR